MSDRSPNLDMPYLMPSQAQKHVTHNEALQHLDAIVQMSVLAFDAVVPPGAPEAGDRYALGAGTINAWAGHDGELAVWDGVAWQFFAPQTGWHAWGEAESELRVFHDGHWNAPTHTELGINASANTTNRLAVAAEATLLTHDGNGHQLKVNKAASSDTASLLYQSNWTGHAEMGLTGDNNWSLKVSPDGANWTEALTIDSATGLAGGVSVQANATDVATGRLMRADFGYCPGNLVGTVSQNAGVPTGSVVERGSNTNGGYVRFADGTQICWSKKSYPNVDISFATGGAFRSDLFNCVFPAAFVDTPAVSITGTRSDGDWDVWAVLSSATTTHFNGLHMKSSSTTSQSRMLHYTATGTWY